MPLAHGDMIMIGSPSPCSAKAMNLEAGTISPRGILFGTFSGDTSTIWNDGNQVDSAGTFTVFTRKVTAFTGTSEYKGRKVQWKNKGPAFSGVCTLQFNTELDDSGGLGTQVPVLEVRSDLGFFFLVEPSNVEIMS